MERCSRYGGGGIILIDLLFPGISWCAGPKASIPMYAVHRHVAGFQSTKESTVSISRSLCRMDSFRLHHFAAAAAVASLLFCIYTNWWEEAIDDQLTAVTILRRLIDYSELRRSRSSLGLLLPWIYVKHFGSFLTKQPSARLLALAMLRPFGPAFQLPDWTIWETINRLTNISTLSSEWRQKCAASTCFCLWWAKFSATEKQYSEYPTTKTPQNSWRCAEHKASDSTDEWDFDVFKW